LKEINDQLLADNSKVKADNDQLVDIHSTGDYRKVDWYKSPAEGNGAESRPFRMGMVNISCFKIACLRYLHDYALSVSVKGNRQRITQ